MLRAIIAVLLIVTLQFYPRYSISQPLTPQSLAYSNELTAAVENILRDNLRAFAPNLTSQEKAIVDKIQIKVDRNNWNLFGTGAFLNRQTGQRGIVLTIGFVIASDYMDRAVLEMSLLDDQKLVSYMRYISESLLKNREASNLGRPVPVPDLKGYCEFVGKSASKCRDLRLNPLYRKQLYAIKSSGLALVLGHEIGHHVKDHLVPNPKNTVLEMESEADRFGASLAVRSRANLLLGMGGFLTLGSFGVDLPVAQSTDQHPHPLCRAVAAMRAGIRDAERHASFKQYLRDNNAEDTMETIKDQLFEIKRSEPACN